MSKCAVSHAYLEPGQAFSTNNEELQFEAAVVNTGRNLTATSARHDPEQFRDVSLPHSPSGSVVSLRPQTHSHARETPGIFRTVRG